MHKPKILKKKFSPRKLREISDSNVDCRLPTITGLKQQLSMRESNFSQQKLYQQLEM